MFRSLFSRKPAALTGAPALPRLKTYSSQSGYVYQYCYQGQRHLRHPEATEFVFRLSADRKTWRLASVIAPDAVIAAWQNGHDHTLSPTESYAAAKMALFQAFDERATPELMRQPIELRPDDLAAIIESLGL